MALSARVRLFAPRLGALLLAAALLGGCQRSAGDVVRIGVAGSFSDPIGLPMRQAAELAAAEINANGGVNGKRLELVLRDDYSDPDSAVFVAGDLYSSDVSAVVGHLFSGMTLAAAPVYNGGTTPVVAISPSSSSPEVSGAGDYTFRICPSDLAHGTVLAHWVRDRLHFRHGAVLYLNDEYGRGIRQTFVTEFTRLGGELTAVYPYLGERPDVEPYLDRLREGRSPGVHRGGREPERGRRDPAPGAEARPHHAGARRRRPRGNPGGRRAGRGRVSLLALFPVHSERAEPPLRRRRSDASIPTPACPTSRRRRPTTRSTCCAT